MLIYGGTTLLSAFLLFQVQFILAKYILPWFGGAPAVWTTCMLFFQAALLGGYAYAHWLVGRRSFGAQRIAHLALLAGAVALIAVLAAVWGSPILPDSGWKPGDVESPRWLIVKLLAVSIGAPFFVLGATSSLVQAWFAVASPGRSPYRLYVLSNVGSLLGLVTYPFLVEVWLPIATQAQVWAAGFVLFAVGMAGCAIHVGRMRDPHPVTYPPLANSTTGWSRWLLWLALSACGSVLLLATTNQMSQEVAVVPFLWMAPLCVYLVSFILCFESSRWYGRATCGALLALGLALSVLAMDRGVSASITIQIVVPTLTLFVACMVCHGELVLMKPAARDLTSFYLAVSIGGVAGGIVVGLIAPSMFSGMWEYPIALWAVAAILVVLVWRDHGRAGESVSAWPVHLMLLAAVVVGGYVFRDRLLPKLPEISDGWLFGAPTSLVAVGLVAHGLLQRTRRSDPSSLPAAIVPAAVSGRGLVGVSAALALLLFAGSLVYLVVEPSARAVYESRNFYGVLRVVEESSDDPDLHAIKLRHGRIVHGVQYPAPDKRREPTAYYGRESGIGLAIANHPGRERGLRIGVIGLGVGTLAAYGDGNDVLRFYEINPDVVRLAGVGGRTFTFLSDTAARVEVALGDARITLERELAHGTPQRFDVLALDAFSSDAIPIHLLTREAAEVYLGHLAAGGILAIHISNRFLDLEPVVRGIARQFGLAHVFVSSEGNDELSWRSTWALLARTREVLDLPAIAGVADDESPDAPAVLWTDGYSNLFRAVKR